jgi:chromate transporter
MIFFQLFLTFFEIGLFTFGGGYAMISIVFEKVLEHGWLTEAELLNMIAVAESTPGPIAVNMATFVGSVQGSAECGFLGPILGGIIGSACATLGVVLPSFIIILLISAILKNFLNYVGVQAFLSGVRPCVVGLILGTAINLFLSTLVKFKSIFDGIPTPDIIGLIIFAMVVLVSFGYKKIYGKKPSPIVLIIASAVLGMILYSIKI